MNSGPFHGLTEFFKPPETSDLIGAHRVRFLHYTLILSFFGGIVIGLVNAAMQAYVVAAVIFFLPLYGFLGLWLNRRGHYGIAALLLALVSFLIIVYNLFDGAGLHDPATAGLLLWIVLVALLFDRVWILAGCGLSILSVGTVALLDQTGIFRTPYPASYFRVFTLGTVYVLASLSLWIFAGSWRRTLDELQESYDRTLEGWVKALELKDPATSGHSQRGVGLTLALARRIGFQEAELDQIRRGALLHDIGKIAVPDHVLSKPGPLDPAEWEIMRQHPVYAREMLSGIRYLQGAIAIPYCHHEAWDGSGYPEGLRGEKIPLPARIFTLVDHWEALREDRPYRPAWPLERVLDHINSNAGKIFDPQVVQAFMGLRAERPDLFR